MNEMLLRQLETQFLKIVIESNNSPGIEISQGVFSFSSQVNGRKKILCQITLHYGFGKKRQPYIDELEQVETSLLNKGWLQKIKLPDCRHILIATKEGKEKYNRLKEEWNKLFYENLGIEI